MHTTQEAALARYAAQHKAQVDAYCARAVAEGRFDDAAGLAIAKQLSHVSRELVKQQFPELRFRDLIPPVGDNGSIAPGAATYEWHYMEKVGEAEISASLGGTSNRVDVGINGDPNVANLRHIRASYEIGDDELEAAALAGVALSMEKPMLAREAIERKKDLIAFKGDSAHGLKGLLTDANVPEVNSAATFAAMSAADLYTWLIDHTDSIWVDSAQIFAADTLILPPAQFKILKAKRFSTASDSSVLKLFLESSQFIKSVDYSRHLIGASDTSTDLALVYAKRPEVVGYIESVLYMESAPTRNGFSTSVEGRGRFGGVAWRIPNAAKKIGDI